VADAGTRLGLHAQRPPPWKPFWACFSVAPCSFGPVAGSSNGGATSVRAWRRIEFASDGFADRWALGFDELPPAGCGLRAAGSGGNPPGTVSAKSSRKGPSTTSVDTRDSPGERCLCQRYCHRPRSLLPFPPACCWMRLLFLWGGIGTIDSDYGGTQPV
jgi:hypothetical protein